MSVFSSSTLLLVRSEFDGTNTSRKRSFIPRDLQIIYVIFRKYFIFKGRNVIHFSRFSFPRKSPARCLYRDFWNNLYKKLAYFVYYYYQLKYTFTSNFKSNENVEGVAVVEIICKISRMFKIPSTVFTTWNLCLDFICLITFINIQICIIALGSLFYFLLLGSSVQSPAVQHFKRFLRKTNFSSSSTRLFNSNYARKNADIGGPIRRKSDAATRDRSNPRTLLDIFKFCLTRSLAKLIEFRRNSLRDPEAQRNSSHAYTRRFQRNHETSSLPLQILVAAIYGEEKVAADTRFLEARFAVAAVARSLFTSVAVPGLWWPSTWFIREPPSNAVIDFAPS